mmetsp:Transcript_48002/g.114092  ORF Transcript_48002/g.114092 Transcript_48002/m.114092 type:complete len:176 (-) Transcript_48002:60-587(-)
MFTCCCLGGEEKGSQISLDVDKVTSSNVTSARNDQEGKEEAPESFLKEPIITSTIDAADGGSSSIGLTQFTATFNKESGKPLGAELFHGRGGDKGLCQVKSVSSNGVFAEWNSSHPDKQIRDRLFIVEINGKAMEFIGVQDMQKMLKENEVTITFSKRKPQLTSQSTERNQLGTL